MKQADRMDGQAAPTDPVRGRAADARAGRPEEAASSGYQGKDLRIPNTMLEQLARTLLLSSPAPHLGEQGAPGD